MPQYTYRAKTSALDVIEGTIEADSETSAVNQLGNQGIFPFRIAEVSGNEPSIPSAPTSRRRPVAIRALSYLTRQLADLLGGGLPLLNALTLLEQQTEHPYLREVVARLSAGVRDGQALSTVMSRHPEVFSLLYINMVKAGEVGGGLEAVLNRLADLGDAEADLQGRVVTALAYPTVVVLFGIATVAVLLVYVIPKITGIFAESGQLLPLPTRILMSISAALTHGWWLIALVLIGAFAALRQWHARPGGRAAVDRLILHVPLLGLLIRKMDTARFTRNLGVMIGQGVSVLQALDVATQTVGNVTLRQSLQRVEEDVREGSGIAAALSSAGQFPAFVSNMVSVGEESGTIDTALLKVAATYEREVDRTMRTLTTLLEPLLIIVVGLVVGFIVISMLLPIFQIGLAVNQ